MILERQGNTKNVKQGILLIAVKKVKFIHQAGCNIID